MLLINCYTEDIGDVTTRLENGDIILIKIQKSSGFCKKYLEILDDISYKLKYYLINQTITSPNIDIKIPIQIETILIEKEGQERIVNPKLLYIKKTMPNSHIIYELGIELGFWNFDL